MLYGLINNKSNLSKSIDECHEDDKFKKLLKESNSLFPNNKNSNTILNGKYYFPKGFHCKPNINDDSFFYSGFDSPFSTFPVSPILCTKSNISTNYGHNIGLKTYKSNERLR